MQKQVDVPCAKYRKKVEKDQIEDSLIVKSLRDLLLGLLNSNYN